MYILYLNYTTTPIVYYHNINPFDLQNYIFNSQLIMPSRLILQLILPSCLILLLIPHNPAQPSPSRSPPSA